MRRKEKKTGKEKEGYRIEKETKIDIKKKYIQRTIKKKEENRF